MKKKILLLILMAILLISIPLTLLFTQKKQETQTRASGSTTLKFAPDSTPSSPIQAKLGDPISIDIMVNPGSNLVSFVRLQVKFDPAKVALADTNAFVPNAAAFPVTIEGPVTASDTLAVSVSVGSDPTKSIQQITKLGTLNFKAIGPTTNEPTQITYTTLSQALSASQNDQAAENILSTTVPAYITVSHEAISPTVTTPASSCTPNSTNFYANLTGAGVTPRTNSEGSAIVSIGLATTAGFANAITTTENIALDQVISLNIYSPSITGNPLILFNNPNGGSFTSPHNLNNFALPANVLSDMRNGTAYLILGTKQLPNGEIQGPITCTNPVTAAPTSAVTSLNLNILLHGIGSAGDNPNPNGNSLSNKNPLHPQRNITVTLIDSNNQEVASRTDSITFNTAGGNFTGLIDLGTSFNPGNYNLKIKTDKYLRKLVSGIINIKAMTNNDVPQTALVAGDVKDDNILNVLDYNILLDCGYGAINPLPLADPASVYNSSYCISHNEFRPNTDLDDNGIIDSSDYNLFLRELSVQNGD